MIDLLNHTIDVFSQQYSRDTSGGLVIADGTKVLSGIPARVEDSNAVQNKRYGFRQIDTTHIVFVLQTGIQNGMVVRWTSSDGEIFTFRVTDTKFRREIDGMDSFFVIGCIEVDRQLPKVL